MKRLAMYGVTLSVGVVVISILWKWVEDSLHIKDPWGPISTGPLVSGSIWGLVVWLKWTGAI